MPDNQAKCCGCWPHTPVCLSGQTSDSLQQRELIELHNLAGVPDLDEPRGDTEPPRRPEHLLLNGSTAVSLGADIRIVYGIFTAFIVICYPVFAVFLYRAYEIFYPKGVPRPLAPGYGLWALTMISFIIVVADVASMVISVIIRKRWILITMMCVAAFKILLGMASSGPFTAAIASAGAANVVFNSFNEGFHVGLKATVFFIIWLGFFGVQFVLLRMVYIGEIRNAEERRRNRAR